MIKSALNNLSGPSIANIQPGGKDRWQRWLRQFGEKERHATIDWCMLSMPSFIVAAGKPFLPVHAPWPYHLGAVCSHTISDIASDIQPC